MKVTLERLPESRVQLDIEVDSERLQRSLDAAYKRLAARTRVPGFRPGKAPRAMIERHIGRDRLMNEALDKLVPDVYNEALETEDIDAIAQPELDKLELDPVRLKFIVPVRPTVGLGDYRAIRVEHEPVEATDGMVEEQLNLLRRRYAVQVPVERGARWDDILTGDVVGEIDGKPFVRDEDAEFPLREGQVLLIPGLTEAFQGMKKGEEKAVDLTIPDDFSAEDYRGKTATFTLTIKEVKEEQLPDLDDEFANQVNADEFPTLDALRERIRHDILESLEEGEKARFRSAAVDKLVALATLEYPRVMVEREIDHLVSDSVGNDHQAYHSYLARVGRSEAEYRESLREAAETRLRRGLVLGELAEAESIDVTPEEIEAELERLIAPMGDDAARFREMFSSPQGVETIRRNLTTQKTLDRVAAIANGDLQEEPA